MPTVRIRLAYDGTDFQGWQVQPAQRTVQGVLELAIQELTGESLRVLAASRTDAGVHALGQVVNFTTAATIPIEKWVPALQSKLPADVVLIAADEVASDFHATYSARSKRYRYVIYNSRTEHVFLRRYCWRIGIPLSIEAMHDAAQVLIGTHDFRSFETAWPNKATSIRTISHLEFRRLAVSELFAVPTAPPAFPRSELGVPDEFLAFEIEADGFLYNMVRAIVGTLVNVGRGYWSATDVKRVLTAQDRTQAGDTAPAQGLYLVQVNYSN